MDCTDYNAAINYNAPINYNGVCTSPPISSVIGGGHVIHDYHRIKPKKYDDDFAIVLAALELTDDDY